MSDIWNTWSKAHEAALATSTDLAWDQLDKLTIDCCKREPGGVDHTRSLIEAGIVRLGGEVLVDPEPGPATQVWMEHVLQVLWLSSLNEIVIRDSQTDRSLAMHSIARDGRIISVTDSWCRLLGYSRGDVLGRLSTDFLTDESREKAQNIVLPEFWRTGVCRVDYDMISKNGKVVSVDMAATSEIGADSDIIRSLAVIRKK